MSISVLQRFTAPYSAAESWLYDRFIAPAVADLRGDLEREILGEVPEGARVLDVGSGGGQLAVGLAETRPDLQVTGLDLSVEQVTRARRRARHLGERVRFVGGSALDMPFDDESFDGVYSVASIKHWPDPRRGLEECVRVLRPGGGLLVVEADRGCRLEDVRGFVARWRLPAPLRVVSLAFFRTWVAGQSLDLEEMRALVDGLPLEEVEVRRIPGTPGLLLRARRRG